MEINEKKHKKEQQELIIRKYQQYLKLEKSLSLNTLDAYLTDLDKLMSFLTLEGIYVLDVCLSDLQRFAAGLHDIGIHPRSQARIFYRNSIDIGLPIIECPAAAKAIRDGDEVAVHLDTGVIEDRTTGERFTAAPFPPFIQKIIAVGGIENFVREKIAGKA